MAEEFGQAGQNVTGEVNDKTVAFITWTILSLFVLVNLVVISFQIYRQRSKFFSFSNFSFLSHLDLGKKCLSESQYI